jgi:motility quorum-sensing regulator/GCU-specific mRNA interferase toxin
MEKRNPHCNLPVVKELARVGKVRTTHSARAGANDLGIDFQGMLDVCWHSRQRIFTKV